MTAAEQLKKERSYDIARRMLQAGESSIKIRQYTGLSQKEINQLKKNVD